jgi:hypothetical protein
MPRQPILTIGDLEPDRPTVAINRNAPDGRWQRFKYDHLDLLLRWWPVRFKERRDLYPLRHPSEFGMRTVARIGAAQREIAELQGGDADRASWRRTERLLREVSYLVLDAPRDVINDLTPTQHIQLLVAFAASATGPTPTKTPPTGNPSTSAGSSPGSAASTPDSAGTTG